MNDKITCKILKEKLLSEEGLKYDNVDAPKHFQLVPGPTSVSYIDSVSAYNFIISITMYVFAI